MHPSSFILQDTPPPADNADHVAAAHALLGRTAELPAARRELMNVLSEYRAALANAGPSCSAYWVEGGHYALDAAAAGPPRAGGPENQRPEHGGQHTRTRAIRAGASIWIRAAPRPS